MVHLLWTNQVRQSYTLAPSGSRQEGVLSRGISVACTAPRLQDAGYRPEAQDWDEVEDSDSDSDHSEDEAEKDEDISHLIV